MTVGIVRAGSPDWFFKMRGGLMRTEPRPYEVRALVVRVFKELGTPASDSDDLNETIIVSDGKYVSRSYRMERLYAIWLIDDGIVVFHDTDGCILRRANLFEQPGTHRMAA
jgi:hypothetical protein